LALQTHLANASTDNATQAANQTGEKMQSGMANVTQESKSAGNQTGEEGQSMLNQTGWNSTITYESNRRSAATN
jgi:hypothetical protein